MIVIDNKSGLKIGDPDSLPETAQVELGDLQTAMENLILSASGWRKIFAADGQEQSFTEEVQPADILLAALMAQSFADFLAEDIDKGVPRSRGCRIAVGTDSRPTGPALADAMIRVFAGDDFDIEYLFITAAPEIMAYTGSRAAIDAFVYISASHNPPGHNGVKFGLDDGAVLEGRWSTLLIDRFRRLCRDASELERVKQLIKETPADRIEEIYRGVEHRKETAAAAYYSFTMNTAFGSGPSLKNVLACELEKYPLGVVAEFNGSARTLSIDTGLFKELGLAVHALNERPRQIVHRIVPEGESLEPCRLELEKIRQKRPEFLFGFVPDNDGDRGNLVYFDERSGSVRILPAQEVFALSVLSELAYLRYSSLQEVPADRTAVVANGPTSLMIDRICRGFKAELFRAEVGEANVVALARKLRSEGYTVRILGEGSNGGTIIHPSAVRDPLQTILSLVKLLRLPADKNGRDLLDIWVGAAGGSGCPSDSKKRGFGEVLGSLPRFTATGVFEERALLRIKTQEHARLKAAFESIFSAEWRDNGRRLEERFGITGWRELQFEGSVEREGTGPDYRSAEGAGGLKILFQNEEGEDTASLWMRGSKTEPVFRLMAEVPGDDPEGESEMLEWLREMVIEADRRASAGA
ncbi:MAG: hypothetical protein K9L68_12550 [Spirochaetales bacterium]|nr:hypothetical protein [Spirochaetales bacterium]MCF7939421.1 hypothetical protein [Spirochaetales bacterium]